MHPKYRKGKRGTTVPDQRGVFIRGLAASAVPPDTDTATVAYSNIKIRGRCVGVELQDPAKEQHQEHPTTIATRPVPLLIYKHRTTRNSLQ